MDLCLLPVLLHISIDGKRRLEFQVRKKIFPKSYPCTIHIQVFLFRHSQYGQ